ncbi:phenylethanolamine N-methyltransferase [Sylvia borin]
MCWVDPTPFHVPASSCPHVPPCGLIPFPYPCVQHPSHPHTVLGARLTLSPNLRGYSIAPIPRDAFAGSIPSPHSQGSIPLPTSPFPCSPPPLREPWQDKERRLRQRLRRILPIDVHRPEPLGAPLRPPADALLSAFCLEAVSPDRAAFVRALAHVGNLLRPGGHALLLGALGESFYLAGPARLPVVPLEESDVREALAAAGFALRELRSYAMPPALRTGVDDVDGVFFAHAQKPLEA